MNMIQISPATYTKFIVVYLQKIEKKIQPLFNYSTEHRELDIDELIELGEVE